MTPFSTTEPVHGDDVCDDCQDERDRHAKSLEHPKRCRCPNHPGGDIKREFDDRYEAVGETPEPSDSLDGGECPDCGADIPGRDMDKPCWDCGSKQNLLRFRAASVTERAAKHCREFCGKCGDCKAATKEHEQEEDALADIHARIHEPEWWRPPTPEHDADSARDALFGKAEARGGFSLPTSWKAGLAGPEMCAACGKNASLRRGTNWGSWLCTSCDHIAHPEIHREHPRVGCSGCDYDCHDKGSVREKREPCRTCGTLAPYGNTIGGSVWHNELFHSMRCTACGMDNAGPASANGAATSCAGCGRTDSLRDNARKTRGLGGNVGEADFMDILPKSRRRPKPQPKGFDPEFTKRLGWMQPTGGRPNLGFGPDVDCAGCGKPTGQAAYGPVYCKDCHGKGIGPRSIYREAGPSIPPLHRVGGLKRQALAAAIRRGHDMGPWDGILSASSVCNRCGRSADIDVAPPPNGIDIGGAAVAVDCGTEVAGWTANNYIRREAVVSALATALLEGDEAEPVTVARWVSKSGKHWVALHRFEFTTTKNTLDPQSVGGERKTGYSYNSTDGSGGYLGWAFPTDQHAIAHMQQKVEAGLFQPDAAKTKMRRVTAAGTWRTGHVGEDGKVLPFQIKVDDWGTGNHTTARPAGNCASCGRQTYDTDAAGGDDPRGPLGTKVASPLTASDYDMEGPDVPMCYGCFDTRERYEVGVAKAKALWKPKAAPVSEADDHLGVANEILRQLGGNRFRVCTGAHSFVGHPDALSFGIPRNQSRANKVKITLTPADTYRVEFFRVHKAGTDLLHAHDDIYNDNLRDVFTDTTGMVTSLGTMGRKAEATRSDERCWGCNQLQSAHGAARTVGDYAVRTCPDFQPAHCPCGSVRSGDGGCQSVKTHGAHMPGAGR